MLDHEDLLHLCHQLHLCSLLQHKKKIKNETLDRISFQIVIKTIFQMHLPGKPSSPVSPCGPTSPLFPVIPGYPTSPGKPREPGAPSRPNSPGCPLSPSVMTFSYERKNKEKTKKMH